MSAIFPSWNILRWAVSGKIFGYSRSWSQCFQVQLVTCWHLSDFHYQSEGYSPSSSKMMGKSPEVLNFNRSASSVTSSRFSPLIDSESPHILWRLGKANDDRQWRDKFSAQNEKLAWVQITMKCCGLMWPIEGQCVVRYCEAGVCQVWSPTY